MPTPIHVGGSTRKVVAACRCWRRGSHPPRRFHDPGRSASRTNYLAVSNLSLLVGSRSPNRSIVKHRINEDLPSQADQSCIHVAQSERAVGKSTTT